MSELEQELTARIKEGDDLVNAERYEEALTAFEQAFQLDANNPLVYLKKSAVLEKLERYQEALDLCLRAIELDHENAHAYQKKGEILLDLEQYEESLIAFGQAAQMNSSLGEALFGKGNVLYSLGRYGEALTAYEQVIQLNPMNASAYAEKGMVLWLLKRNDDALVAWDQAIQMDPNQTQAIHMKGWVLQSLNRLEEALIFADRVIQLHLHWAWTYCNRGDVLMSLERYEAALEVYNYAIELEPNTSRAYLSKGGVLERLERYEEALEVYERAIEVAPEEESAYRNKGRMLERFQRYEEAVTAFERSIQLITSSNQSHSEFSLSFSYWLMGDVLFWRLERYEEGLVAYEQAIKLRSDDSYLYEILIRALKKFERYEEAVAVYKRQVEAKAGPTSAWDHYQMGELLEEKLAYDEDALVAYDRAIQLDPKHTYAYKNKASLLKKLKRYEEALVLYDQLLQIETDSYEHKRAWRQKADLLKEQGRYEEAAAAYERAESAYERKQALRLLGDRLKEQERYEEAASAYEQAEATYERNQALRVLGDRLKEQGRYEEAASAYEQAGYGYEKDRMFRLLKEEEQKRNVLDVVNRFINTSDWNEKLKILEQEHSLLLTDEADDLLYSEVAVLADSTDPLEERRRHYLEVHLAALRVLQDPDADDTWERVQELFFQADGIFEPDAEARTNALGAFLAADTWGKKYDILQHHQALLLKKSVDRDLSQMIWIYAQNEDSWQEAWHHRLHLLLLRFARERGVDTVWDDYESLDEAEKRQSINSIAEALFLYLFASTWQDKFDILQGAKELLVTAAGITLLEAMIFDLLNSDDREDKKRKHDLEVHLAALQMLQGTGPENPWQRVQELFFQAEGVFKSDVEATTKALRAFIDADTWGEKHDILIHHQALLLENAVETELSDMIEIYKKRKDIDEQYYHYLHLLLLRFAKARGADTIWNDYELIGEAEKRQSTRAIAKALFAYGVAPTWQEKFQILEREENLLVTAAGITFLAVTIFNMEVPQSGEQAIFLLYTFMQLDLLLGARLSGLTPAWIAFQKVYAEQLRHQAELDRQLPVLQGDVESATNVLQEFLAATWDKREALLERNAAVLLEDTVNALILIEMKKLQKSSDPQDQPRLAVVASHRALLLRARDIGISAAWAEFSSLLRQGERQEVLEAIFGLTQAETVDEAIKIVEAQEHLLLAENTDHILANLIEEVEAGDASEQEELLPELKAYRRLFQRAHEIGISAACIEFNDEMYQYEQKEIDKQQMVKDVISAWLQVQREDMALKMLEEHAALLLTESTDQILTRFIKDVEAEHDPSKDEIHYALTLLRTLFRRAREIGIVAAYEELEQQDSSEHHVPYSLRRIMDEISRITQFQEFPRRIALLQEVIERVEAGEGDRALWGSLQYQLGAILSQNPVGNLQENQERAIGALEKSLQVFTPEAYPREWANVQNVLGTIYTERVAGKKAENLEQAIAYFEASIEVATREAFPREWSQAQSNLAAAYAERIWGDRSENLEKAIASTELALQVLTYEAFPYDWARAQNNLGIAYQDRFQGNKAENLEKAIECYERSLQVYTLESYPFEWARTQMNIAMAYTVRMQGDRAENQEQALACCKEALRIYTREAFPRQWASTQFDLGVIYAHRVRGDISDNIEQALQCYLAALEVFTYQDLPRDWARTQLNLGSVYMDRVHSDAGDNLERAIAGYEAALEVFTHDEYPIDWAETHVKLSGAFSHRIRGDGSENLEQAIFHIQKALQVFIPSAFPERFYSLVHNLGVIYMRRTKGNKAENLEQAKKRLEASAAFYTPESYPDNWAMNQMSLSALYGRRLQGNVSENMEQAIYHAELALQIYTRESYPQEWAGLQHNLGTIYSDRIQGEHIENLERARLHFEQAVQVRTPDTQPIEYRDTMLALGWLFLNYMVSEGKRRNDDEFVRDAYHRAHLAYLEARQVQAELGWLATDEMGRASLQGHRGDISEMYRRDMWCLLQLGDLKGAAVTLEAGRMQALAESLAISEIRFDEVCVGHAFVFTSARNALLDARASGDLNRMSKTREQFLQVREAIRAHCRPDFLPSEPSYQDIAQAAAPNQALVYLDGTAYGGVALVVPPAQNNSDGNSRPPFAIPLRLLTTDTINSWYVRQDAKGHWTGGYYFVLYRASTDLLSYWIEYADNEEERLSREMMAVADVAEALPVSMSTVKEAMKEMIASWYAKNASYSQKSKLQQKIAEQFLQERLSMPLGEAINHKILTDELNWFLHQAELNQLLVHMQGTFASELREQLDQHNLGDPDQPIALIPCGKLGILPVHAAWTRNDSSSGDGIPFFETCELSYQPSARVFAMARQACHSLPLQGPFIAVGDPQPTKNVKLGWAETEAKVVASLAQIAGRADSRSIVGQSATRQNVLKILEGTRREYTGAWLHIASHGVADATNPSNSYMLLAKDEQFTLADLQRQRLLEGCRGFIASGCETGLGDFETAPDELGGFAMGVLQAGSPCAIATLWPVNDEATFLFMTRLVSYLLEDSAITPAKALRKAAHWLRHATYEQLEAFYHSCTVNNESEGSDTLPGSLPSDREGTERIKVPRTLAVLEHGDILSGSVTVPYAHPYYWASTAIYGV